MSSRCARTLLVLSVSFSTTGCSYLFMEPPPPQHARLDSFQCRTSKGTPTLDVMYGAGQTIGAIALLAIGADGSGADQEEAIGYAIPTAVTAVVAFASGAYGFSAASECNDALEQLAIRQTQARERQSTLEAFSLRRAVEQQRQEAMETYAPPRAAQPAPSPNPTPAPAVAPATPPTPVTP